VTSAGKWDAAYAATPPIAPYGDDTSYMAAAEWTRDCAVVEDWGCGTCRLKPFVDAISPGRYVGIDGSPPFADIVADLTTMHVGPMRADGIVIRHVLEHNQMWIPILNRALACFRQRLFIAVFTPLQPETTVLMTEPNGVPVIGFAAHDVLTVLRRHAVGGTEQIVASDTAYGQEWLLRLER
jgi:hypothetical protein